MPSTPSLKLLAGPQIVGFLLAWGLQGALTVQVYLYHSNFPGDSRAMKLLVYGVLVYEWIQTGLSTSAAIEVYVYEFGNFASIVDFHNTWFSVPIMSAIISGVVQSYFCWRIWIFSRSKILAGAILFLSFAQMVLGIAGGATLRIFNISAVGRAVNRPIVVASLLTGVVVDVIIAAAMTWLLLRSRTGIHHSDDIVLRLARLGIETGAITATAALMYAIFFITYTDNLLFECPALILPKLYSNTLLASLNNRAFIRQPTAYSQSHTFSGAPLVRHEEAPQYRSGLHTDACFERPRVQISVLEETYVSQHHDLKKTALREEGLVELELTPRGGSSPKSSQVAE